MKITVLCENYVKNKGLTAEHGLSLYIESLGKNILFDMGQTDVFLKNSEKLGIDIKSINAAVLSHGHYDHGGGATEFLKANKTSPLYINEDAFGKYYSKNGYIGLDESLKKDNRVVLTKKEKKIFDFVSLYSAENIPLLEKHNSFGLLKETEGENVQDDFLHEQYLLVEENGKRILISGCSHRGILNIMNFFKPDIFVGGLHLSSLEYDSKELMNISEKLSSYETVYYTCHCTGIEQYGMLKQILKNKIQYINCGTFIDI